VGVEADVPLRCACGSLSGALRGASPRSVNRVVCHCDDCQAFADFLEQGDATLDAAGGTEIYQLSPARLAWTAGTDRLACLRLRADGLLRWYSACCRTPLANTLARGGLPFAGLIHRCVDLPPGVDREAVFGPVRARLFGRFARGEGAPDAHPGVPVAQMLKLGGRVLAARLRGEQRRSPFFGSDGGPVAEPRVLPAEALAALRGRRV